MFELADLISMAFIGIMPGDILGCLYFEVLK